MMQIDHLDSHANERLASAMNSVALVRQHEGHSCFTSAHAQAMLLVYTTLTHLAVGTAFQGSSFASQPGAAPGEVSAENSGLEALSRAADELEARKRPAVAIVSERQVAEYEARTEEIAEEVEREIVQPFRPAAE